MDLARIINARETLEEKKEQLLKYYTEEYGRKYNRRIKRTLDTTCYIFDSKPNIAARYLASHNESIPESLYQECEAYERFLKRKEDIAARVILSALYPFYTGPSYEEALKHRLDIAHLNIGMLSSAKKNAYKNSPSYERYLELREKIRSDFSHYGIILPRDQISLDNICEMINKVRSDVSLITLDTDPYAEKIRHRIYEETGLMIDRNHLSSLLYESNLSSRCLRYNAPFEHHTIVYLPLLQNIDKASPDLLFYHENRHAIESHNKGLSFVGDYNSLKALNEVRTEKRALQDNENLGLLFATRPHTSAYIRLIPMIDPLDEKYKDFIDECAITGSTARMNKAFGKEELQVLDRAIAENSKMAENVPLTDCSALLQMMDEHATSRGIKPSQKVKK